MRKELVVTCLMLAAVLFTPTHASADGPETGVVTGSTVDAAGAPLPGVTVTLTGDRGSSTTITDENGAFRFALLTPGSYQVKGELESFRTAEAVTTVAAGGKAEVELRMTIETSEQITVTSEAPMVDKFNVTAGSTVTSEVGEQAAGSTRTYYGVVNMLPGVTNDADNQDIQQMRPSVNGAHFADNAVFIDGVDTTYTRFGGSRIILPTTSTSEVTLEGGGSSAEYGRVVGSSTNVIVKSGTNQYHGDAAYQRQETDWNAEYQDQPLLEQREVAPAPRDFLKRVPEEKEGEDESYEVSVGGPIVRDKAWFFAGYSDIDTFNLDKALNGDLVDTSIKVESRIAKLNFQPTSAHSLSASYIETPLERVYFHPPSGDRYSPTLHDLSGDLVNLNWNWSISQNHFLETKVATQTSNEDKYLMVGDGRTVSSALAEKQLDPRFPPNPALGEHFPGNNFRVYLDAEDDDSWHNGWLLDNGFGLNEYPRDQANAALTWFAGENHELKFGVDYQTVKWSSDVQRVNLYSGDVFTTSQAYPFGYTGLAGLGCGFAVGNICFYRDYNPPDLVALNNGQPGNKIETESENTALYLRDRFTVGDHWTFNLGVRASDTQNKNEVGRSVVDETVIAPRLATSYDVKADGRMLLSLNAGRYYAQVNQQFVNEWLVDTWNGYSAFDDYLYCSGLDEFLGSPTVGGQPNPNFVPALGFCGFFGEGYWNWRSLRQGDMWRLHDAGVIDVDIEPYYKDEIILGFEWQFSRNWAVDAKGIYWELDDLIGNTIQRDPDGNFIYLSENYKDYPDLLRAMGQVPEDVINGFEEGKKLYKAIQLQLNRRYANGWAWYNNVTLAELWTTGAGAWWNNTNDTYGEDLGTVLTQAGIDSCVAQQATRTFPVDCVGLLTPFLGQPLSTINRYGRNGINIGTEGGSGVDRPFIFKSFGFKNWTVGRHNFTLGGLLTWQDGVAWGRNEGLDTPVPTNGQPVIQTVGVMVEPNGTRRLDDHYELNLSGAWGFPMGWQDLRGEFRVEVTNVTDQQEQIAVNGRGEVRRVRREFQRPRQIRALFSLRF